MSASGNRHRGLRVNLQTTFVGPHRLGSSLLPRIGGTEKDWTVGGSIRKVIRLISHSGGRVSERHWRVKRRVLRNEESVQRSRRH